MSAGKAIRPLVMFASVSAAVFALALAAVFEPGRPSAAGSENVTLGDVVRALNLVGVTPRELIAILQAIKAAGALQAELEII